jgi:hypothetical protein
MKPVSPVVEGFEKYEIVLAKDQPEYRPLPALHLEGHKLTLTRWQPTWKERLRLIFGGSVYLWTWTYGHSFHPTSLEIRKPELQLPPDVHLPVVNERKSDPNIN